MNTASYSLYVVSYVWTDRFSKCSHELESRAAAASAIRLVEDISLLCTEFDDIWPWMHVNNVLLLHCTKNRVVIQFGNYST